MKIRNNFVRKLILKESVRYIIVGLLNTILGYFIGVLFLYLLISLVPTYVIGLISTVVSIFLNFLLYSLFVFGFSKQWLHQLSKMFQVYALASILSIGILTLSIDILLFTIWWGQLFAISTGVLVSAVGNYVYSFPRKILRKPLFNDRGESPKIIHLFPGDT